MPWPSWGNLDTEFTYVDTRGETVTKKGHPGTPNLYDPSKPVSATAGSTSAPDSASSATARTCSRRASAPRRATRPRVTGYPEFTDKISSRSSAGGTTSPTRRRQAAEGKNWKTDLSGGIQRVAIAHGCAPFGNAKARVEVWTFPDPMPGAPRAALHQPDRDLVEKYPTYEDRKSFLPPADALCKSIPGEGLQRRTIPLILTSGRLVEYEGGGDETAVERPGSPSCSRTCSPRSTPSRREQRAVIRDGQHGLGRDPHRRHANHEGDGAWSPGASRPAWSSCRSTSVGIFQGEDLRAKYPEGADSLRPRRSLPTPR